MMNKEIDAKLSRDYKKLIKQLELTQEQDDKVCFYANVETNAQVGWLFYIPYIDTSIRLMLHLATGKTTVKKSVGDIYGGIR